MYRVLLLVVAAAIASQHPHPQPHHPAPQPHHPAPQPHNPAPPQPHHPPAPPQPHHPPAPPQPKPPQPKPPQPKPPQPKPPQPQPPRPYPPQPYTPYPYPPRPYPYPPRPYPYPVPTPQPTQTTLTGTIVCAKCGLHETTVCQTVIQIDVGGSLVPVTVYFQDRGDSEGYHLPVCGGASKDGRVTGVVRRTHDGRWVITPTKVEFHE